MATEVAISVVPANEARWEDLQAVFGSRGDAATCQCQWFKCTPAEWRAMAVTELAERLREQTASGDPSASTTSGLVAFVDSEPAGWCAVEPRATYARLLASRVVWSGRSEDPTDESVWAVTCFVTRVGFRRRGVSGALARAAVDFARERGASALEGYPIVKLPGQTITGGELYVGSRSVFADAGFTEVSHPTSRRVVMRIDF